MKDKVTYQQANSEFIACHGQAEANAERATLVGGLIESCMTLKGYKWGQYKTRIR